MKLAWAVQTNLNASTAALLDNACRQNDCEFIPFESIPFSDDISEIPTDKPVMVYGSTRIVKLVEEKQDLISPGVLPITSDWQWCWNSDCLNSSRITCTLGDFHNYFPKLKDEKYFIRPESDYKEFTGEVWNGEEFRHHIASLDEEMMSLRIQISAVKSLLEEYRLFIVDGKVSTGSLYRHAGETMLSYIVPCPVILFAENLCKYYTPADVFVMDVCYTGKMFSSSVRPELKVIEANGFNSCCFYSADVTKFVKDVSDFYGRIS